jgi:organic hydroperoxide reductase OsmC/OhrA
MDFSAPPDAHGHPGVLTPEDAFVAAINTCVMMMFIWSARSFKLDLVSYDCYAEGTKRIALDRTEAFTTVALRPRIVVRAGGQDKSLVGQRVRRALESARKYSLVANSVKSQLLVEPAIEVMS